MARRAAATKGNANLLQLQQLQLQFNPSGELKAGHSPKTFRISDCADNWYGHVFKCENSNAVVFLGMITGMAVLSGYDSSISKNIRTA